MFKKLLLILSLALLPAAALAQSTGQFGGVGVGSTGTATSGNFVVGPGASSFFNNTYLQNSFNSKNVAACLDYVNATCLRIINQVDSAGAANVVGTSSVGFANHTSGTITNYWGGEADVSNANTGNVTFLAGWATGVHLRGAGAHGTVTNAINFLAFPCDMPDAAASTFTSCYSFFANPTLNGSSFNFGFYQAPNTTGSGLSGTNVFSDAVQIQQGLSATAGTNDNSPTFSQIGSIWNGAAATNETWAWQVVPLAGGANPNVAYNLTHAGSSGTLIMQWPANLAVQPATTNTGTLGNSGNSFAAATVGKYNTGSNCQLGGAAGTASPAACGSASAGMIAIPVSLTSYTVNTTQVTANSEIQIRQVSDNSGLPSSPTCNATATSPMQSARVAGTSFTFTLTPTANVTCYTYQVIN